MSGGASADPSFIGGCQVLLNTLTAANSATLSDTTSFTSTYTSYMLVFSNLVAGTNNTSAELQLHSNGSFQTTSYLTSGIAPNASSSSSFVAPTTYIPLSATTAMGTALPGINGVARIFNASGTSGPKIVTMQMGLGGGATARSTLFMDPDSGTVATLQLTVFSFCYPAGNITSGTIEVYGIK